jgi:hypothetical protein
MDKTFHIQLSGVCIEHYIESWMHDAHKNTIQSSVMHKKITLEVGV